MNYRLPTLRHGLVSFIVAVTVALSTGPGLFAQSIDLQILPASVVNQPDYDLHGLQRPALSITGFDNRAHGYNPAFGLGLKQILEGRFVDQDPLIVPVFDRLITLAHTDQQNPYIVGGPDLVLRREQLDRNTAILQARAFEALATFVLELNGYHPPSIHPDMLTHGAALSALADGLANPPGGLIYGDWLDDYVKYGRSVANVARSIDLYLALENAYVQVLSGSLPPFAGLRPDLLLTEPERITVMTEFGTAVIIEETVLTTKAIDLYASDLVDILPPDVVEYLLWKLERLPAGNRTVEEVEAGNWAMKQRASAGYASMAMQMDPNDSYAPVIRDLLDKAFRSLTVSHKGDKSRLHHWNWMTYGGERFWPESTFYLDFALEEVLAFWHAARANDLLGNDDDPFFSSWFTNALNWHADLVTPDGRVTAMDDGNKVAMRYSGLMRWDGGYGEAEVGRKFAWVEQTLNGPARRDETLLLEIAIPRTNNTQAPAARIGNDKGPLQVNRSEQQLIIRSTPPQEETHFVFLNGEHGVAVDRGEGHEQADQLNLLYYVGTASYLADSGYDRGYTVENSFWNHYYDHNVMTVGDGEGGLDPPMLNILDVRKESEPTDVGQVDALHFEDHGNVTVLHGEQVLHSDIRKEYKADYVRDVLFIDGVNPYVVDINSVSHRIKPKECDANVFRMNYHVNSGDVNAPASYVPRSDGFLRWNGIDGEDDRQFELYPMSVEFELTATDVSLEADQILEKQDDIIGKILVDIAKLVVSDTNRCRPYWTVATLMHPTSQSDLTSDPAMLWSSGGETSRQGWVWDRGDDVYDVFVLRSVEDKQTEVSFSLADANPGFPSLNLSLPKGLSYGFARVMPEAGAWVVEPDYLVGLMEGSSDKKPKGKAEVLPATANAQRESYGLSNVFPNPATSVSTFTLQVPLAETITVDVYDVTGRRVSLVHDGVLAAGTPYGFRIDTSNWAPGLYVIRARGEFTNQTRTLLRSN